MKSISLTAILVGLAVLAMVEALSVKNPPTTKAVTNAANSGTGLQPYNQPKDLTTLKPMLGEESPFSNQEVTNLMNKMAIGDNGIIKQASTLLASKKKPSESQPLISKLTLLGYKTTIQDGSNDLYYLRVIFDNKYIFHVKIQLNGCQKAKNFNFPDGAKLDKVLGPKLEKEEINKADLGTAAEGCKTSQSGSQDNPRPPLSGGSALDEYKPKQSLEELKSKFKAQDINKEEGADNTAVQLLMQKKDTDIRKGAEKILKMKDSNFASSKLRSLTLLGYRTMINPGFKDVYYLRVIFGSDYIFHVKIQLNDYNKSTGDYNAFIQDAIAKEMRGPKKEDEEINQDELGTSADPTTSSGSVSSGGLDEYKPKQSLEELKSKFKTQDMNKEESADDLAVQLLMQKKEKDIQSGAEKLLKMKDPNFVRSKLRSLTLLGYRTMINPGFKDVYYLRVIFGLDYIFHVKVQLNDYNKSTGDYNAFIQDAIAKEMRGPKKEDEEINKDELGTSADPTTSSGQNSGDQSSSGLAPYESTKNVTELTEKFKELNANSDAVELLMKIQGEDIAKEANLLLLLKDSNFKDTISKNDISLLGYKTTIATEGSCRDLYFIRMIFSSKYIFHVRIQLNGQNVSTDANNKTTFATSGKEITVRGPKTESEEINKEDLGGEGCVSP